jgi:hypothetical protein
MVSICIGCPRSYYDGPILNIELGIDDGVKLCLEKDDSVTNDEYCLYKIDYDLKLKSDRLFIVFCDLVDGLEIDGVPTLKSDWMEIPDGHASPIFVVMNRHLQTPELRTGNFLYRSSGENGRVIIDLVVSTK